MAWCWHDSSNANAVLMCSMVQEIWHSSVLFDGVSHGSLRAHIAVGGAMARLAHQMTSREDGIGVDTLSGLMWTTAQAEWEATQVSTRALSLPERWRSITQSVLRCRLVFALRWSCCTGACLLYAVQ